MSQEAGIIRNSSGEKIAFKSVHIKGRADGLLANMEITQRYHNDSGKKLEIVYTFPLAWGATLLGLDVALGNKRLQGVVLKKADACERYEEAIDSGDTPILVEQTGAGLYTANLGNIENGESVTVNIRYAQLLQGEHGKFRLRVPCAVAPRYGAPYTYGGLAPHESTAADILVEYPLTLRLVLLGQLAGATASCPSHHCAVETFAGGKAVVIQSGAMLDRDLILHLDCEETPSQVMAGPDMDGHFLMLTAFCPSLPQLRPKPLCLKILADCSGSMSGDSIVLTRKALVDVLAMLRSEDHIAYSRFGDTVRHETNGFIPCSPCLEDATASLAAAFKHTKADMGGTEMERALIAVLTDIPVPKGMESPPCVLLITDGAVWNVDKMVRAALHSGQRVFAIGVGSAPAESLLRELTRQSGGACAFVSPNESILEAIMAMLDKMRVATAGELRVDWGDEPLWQSPLPMNAYAGERVYAFASFAKPPAQAPALHWRVGGGEYQLHAEASPLAWDGALPRLAGAVRMAEATSPKEAQTLALKYQLVSKHSSLFLVHEREGEKSAGPPLLHQIPQMMAAGHGGFGTAKRSTTRPQSYFLSGAPQARRDSWQLVDEASLQFGSGRLSDVDGSATTLEIPAFLRRAHTPQKRKSGLGAGPAYLRLRHHSIWQAPYMLPLSDDIDALLHLAGKTAETTTSEDKTVQTFILFAKRTDFSRLIRRLCAEKGLVEEQTWALLLHWLLVNYARVQERNAFRLHHEVINTIADATKDEVLRYFDGCFLPADDEAWDRM